MQRKLNKATIEVPLPRTVADDLQKLLFKGHRLGYATIEVIFHPKGITLREHAEYRYTQDKSPETE